jgi:uncharacterized OsmC-like protein
MTASSGNDAAKKDESRGFTISIDSVEGLEFRVKFAGTGFSDLTVDEPAPAGGGKGPNPARLLAAAIGGCLSASLLFCAQKLRLNMPGLHTEVTVTHTRNEKGRLRIGNVNVVIDPRIEDPDEHKLQRCLEMYEDFCVVTQSVRQGLDVSVKVKAP